MAREGLCNPASGRPGYSHDGSGAVAGKPAGGSTIGSHPANKPPVISGDNMSMANMGGMEHVMTSPGKGQHGPKAGGPAKLSTNKGAPGPARARNVDEV